MVAVPERGGVYGTPRDAARWALPKFPDATRTRRAFPMQSRLPLASAAGAATAWGGKHLEQVHVPSLVAAPLAELGLETFFDFFPEADSDRERGVDGAASTDVDGERAARLGALVAEDSESDGLPFVVTQHAAAATPTAKRTLERLRQDIQAAAAKAAAARAARKARRAGGLAAATSADGVVDVAAFRDAHLKGLAPEDVKAVAREAAARLESASENGGSEGVSSPATVRARGALVTLLRALRDLAVRDRAAATEAAAAATSTANGLSRDPSAARAMRNCPGTAFSNANFPSKPRSGAIHYSDGIISVD